MRILWEGDEVYDDVFSNEGILGYRCIFGCGISISRNLKRRALGGDRWNFSWINCDSY